MFTKLRLRASRPFCALSFLVIISGLLLAACGDNTAAPNPTASGQATTAAGTGAATTVAGTGGTSAAPAQGSFKLNKNVSGNIQFWHFWSSPVRRNAVRRVVAICQQELPNIKVTETFKPFGDIW